MKEPVHVVCASSAAYIMPLSVMLASLVDNFDPARELRIHIISSAATARDRENIRESIRMNRPGLEHIEIHWYSLDSSLMEKLPIREDYHFTRDNYARLFAPLALPESCERAVYLDCDMVVLADVSLLYDSTAGNDSVVHATHDLGTPRVSDEQGIFDYVERGIPPDTRCFNAGTLVINMKRWREQDLTPPMLDYLIRNGDKVLLADQGALNAFLHHDWAPLDNRWNQGNDILFPQLWTAAGYSQEEWQVAKDDPYIIHYTGPKKPWQRGRRAPRYSYFYKYLQKTVYKDSIPHRPYLEDVVGLRAYYHLWKWARKIPGMVKP